MMRDSKGLLLLVGLLVLAACGSTEGENASDTTAPSPTSTTQIVVTSTTSPSASSTTTQGVSTTAEGTTTTSTPTTTTSVPATTTTTAMPGEEIDFGPRAGDRLMVIGVAHDDVLNLRAAPGVGQVIVGRIPPDYHDLSAVGITRQLSRSFWILADYEGIQGWVSLRYVAHEGATDDQTARVVEMLGGYPTAASMSALGVIVAETYASEDPQSDVVKVVDETVGDLGEVTYDVIGIGDDASLGFRIHVFGEPIEGGFVLKAVELTDLCGRGVTDDGLCT